MKEYEPQRIRNVGLFAHGGAGKTTLAEALLFRAGAIQRLGKVEEGTATCDYDPDEVRRRMSVSLALAPLEWRQHKINVLDTPGYADFFGEVIEAARVVDTGLILVDAASGVQVGTEAAWKALDGRAVPRMVFVSRMDRENADFWRCLREVGGAFRCRVVPLAVPVGEKAGFRGAVHLVSMHFYDGGDVVSTELPAEVKVVLDAERERLVEAAVESDDELVAKYLEGEQITEEELTRALREGVASGRLVLALCGSALRLKAVDPLLDAVVDYAPSPAERSDEAAEPAGGASSGLAALVFKTVSDPYIGRLNYFRVYSGDMRSDSYVWNVTKGREERIGQLFVIRGKHQEPVPTIVSGDLGAVAKLQDTSTGDTLTVKDSPVQLEGIAFPEPASSAAITPKTKADVDKLSSALSKIVDEDPSLRVHKEPSTGETILSGFGESHVEIAVERMQRKFGVAVSLDVPKVPYRETVKASAKAHGRYKRQTGGHGQFGDVWLQVEPLPRGSDFEFVDRVVGGVVPKQYIPGVEKGVREALQEGILAGYPVVDVRVTLYDGAYHPVDSSELAFKIAASLGFKQAVADAGPVLLEPVVEVGVQVPDEFTGDVMGDLNSRRAQVLGMSPAAGVTTISAMVPYAEMLRYATVLRSLTQGRGTYRMKFSHYDEVPPHLAQQVIERARATTEHSA